MQLGNEIITRSVEKSEFKKNNDLDNYIIMQQVIIQLKELQEIETIKTFGRVQIIKNFMVKLN